MKMSGTERKVRFTAKGEFSLHQRRALKAVELEATFWFSGGRPTGVAVKSVKPFPVDLAEHEVRPRDAFGKFALKTLAELAPKVAKEAAVVVDFTASAGVAMPVKASP
jgi:hypothetical protein